MTKLATLGCWSLLLCGAPILGQQTGLTLTEGEGAADDAGDNEATFLDEVTVTAAHVPTSLRDTPGQVSIVTDEDIEDHLFEDIADLVKYEPGVYVEGDATRLGLNGFNIRGIGGNRVLTQVDGVPTAEQFDSGPSTSTSRRSTSTRSSPPRSSAAPVRRSTAATRSAA